MCSVSIYTWAFPPKTVSDVCLEITSVMRKTASFYWSDRLVKRKSCLPHSEGLSRTTWKREETHFHLMNPLIIHSLACTTSPRLLQRRTVLVDTGWEGKKKKKTAHTVLLLTRESWLWCFPTSLQLKKKNHNSSCCMLALAEEERSLAFHDLANERTRNIYFKKGTGIPLEPV